MLDTTPASVNSAMQRARARWTSALPEQSQQETLRALGDDAIRELVERYVDAWDRGDVDAVVAMLAEDATFSMPPNAQWFRGREAIRAFLPRGPLLDPAPLPPGPRQRPARLRHLQADRGRLAPERDPRHHALPHGRDRRRGRVPQRRTVRALRPPTDPARTLSPATEQISAEVPIDGGP